MSYVLHNKYVRVQTDALQGPNATSRILGRKENFFLRRVSGAEKTEKYFRKCYPPQWGYSKYRGIVVNEVAVARGNLTSIENNKICSVELGIYIKNLFQRGFLLLRVSPVARMCRSYIFSYLVLVYKRIELEYSKYLAKLISETLLKFKLNIYTFYLFSPFFPVMQTEIRMQGGLFFNCIRKKEANLYGIVNSRSPSIRISIPSQSAVALPA